MPKLLFTDETKAALAKEAGITWVPDTNIFNREYDPSSGEEKLYIKMGSSKFFGANPRTVASPNPIKAQTEYLKWQTQGKTMQEVYDAYISSTPPSKQAIMDEIWGGPTGIYDTLDGIEQQKKSLIRMRAKSGSEIFTAKNPDGTDIDARVKVWEYKAQQDALAKQEQNLNSLQDVYKAQLQALTDSEYNLRQKEQERNKIAVDYVKELNDQTNESNKLAQDKAEKDRSYNLDKAKLTESQRQFNLENGITEENTTDPWSVVKSLEWYRDKAYWDINGWAIWYGQHAINGVPVKEGDTIDQATADKDLGNRISNAKFAKLVTVPLSENQKAALYSLEHNVWSGVWGFPNGKKILDQINAGDIEGASNTLANSGIGTTEAKNHTVLPGLVNRRKQEAALLLKTDTTKQTATNTKKVDYSTFLKWLPLKDIDFTPEQTQWLIEATLADYPEKSEKDVIESLINVAPPKVKASLKAQKAVPLIKAEIEKKDWMDWEGVKNTLATLTDEGITPKNAISTLFKAGFFDKYDTKLFSFDEQYDAVAEFADENNLDLKQILKDLNKK